MVLSKACPLSPAGLSYTNTLLWRTRLAIVTWPTVTCRIKLHKYRVGAHTLGISPLYLNGKCPKILAHGDGGVGDGGNQRVVFPGSFRLPCFVLPTHTFPVSCRTFLNTIGGRPTRKRVK
jgi:hypothetical protein